MLENMNHSFFKNVNDNSIISNRKYSNLNPNELKSNLKRRESKYRIKSSSSTLSSKLSTEFYLEYFRILQSIQHPSLYENTISIENMSPPRVKSGSKPRKSKDPRPKSAPG